MSTDGPPRFATRLDPEEHPGYPRVSWDTPPEQLAEYVRHANVWVRAAAACHPKLPGDAYAHAAADPEVVVRYAAATRASRGRWAGPQLLADDPDPWVRGRAVTFCWHDFRRDDLTLDALGQHEHLANQRRPPAESLAVMRNDPGYGDGHIARAMHGLECVGRAGVALLLRDDCDDDTAAGCVETLRDVFGEAWEYSAHGTGICRTHAERRLVVLPIIGRRGTGWRHEEAAAVLIDDEVLAYHEYRIDPFGPR